MDIVLNVSQQKWCMELQDHPPVYLQGTAAIKYDEMSEMKAVATVNSPFPQI